MSTIRYNEDYKTRNMSVSFVNILYVLALQLAWKILVSSSSFTRTFISLRDFAYCWPECQELVYYKELFTLYIEDYTLA